MKTRERFETTFSVASYEADMTGKLSLFALFNRFQELAGMHAEYLQVGYDLLRESKLAWILSRIKLQILSLPSWGDAIQLATWPKGIDRLFAMREFSLKNEVGETLVLATSAWLLVDIDKNRPQRIETLPVDLHFPGAPHAIQATPDKIEMPERLTPVFDRPVWMSDIDTNLHVNNAQYAKWIGDCFSGDQFRDRRLTSLQINYMDETLLGDLVVISKTPEAESAHQYFIEGVSRNKGSRVFQAHITWV